MTTLEMSREIGKRGIYSTGKFGVEVEILNSKMVWGRTRYEIRPVRGVGVTWVDESSISHLRHVTGDDINRAIS